MASGRVSISLPDVKHLSVMKKCDHKKLVLGQILYHNTMVFFLYLTCYRYKLTIKLQLNNQEIKQTT